MAHRASRPRHEIYVQDTRGNPCSTMGWPCNTTKSVGGTPVRRKRVLRGCKPMRWASKMRLIRVAARGASIVCGGGGEQAGQTRANSRPHARGTRKQAKPRACHPPARRVAGKEARGEGFPGGRGAARQTRARWPCGFRRPGRTRAAGFSGGSQPHTRPASDTRSVSCLWAGTAAALSRGLTSERVGREEDRGSRTAQHRLPAGVGWEGATAAVAGASHLDPARRCRRVSPISIPIEPEFENRA